MKHLSTTILITILALCLTAFDGCTRVTPTPSAANRTATVQAQKSMTPYEVTRIVSETPTITPSHTASPIPATPTPVTPTGTALKLREPCPEDNPLPCYSTPTRQGTKTP